MMYLYMPLSMFLASCSLFYFNHKHILLTLISLEFMVINSIYLIYMNLIVNFSSSYLLIFLMTFMISEGILGLSILVYMIRNSGNDYIMSLNLLKW